MSAGVISVEAITQDLLFSRVEGVLNEIEMPVESVTQEVEFPEGLDNIALGATSVAVHLTSGIGFKSRIDQRADLGVFVSNQITEIGHFNQPDLLYLHLFLFGFIDIYTDETYVNAEKYHGIRF